MIVWLASYPRSGNTYFRVLLNYIYGMLSSSLYDESNEPLNPVIVGNTVFNASVEELCASKQIYFRKTHDMPNSDDYPAIYLVRDGRDALVSYARYLVYEQSDRATDEKTNPFWHALHQVISTNDYYGGWGQNVNAWMRRKAPTAFIRFEDLIGDPLNVIRRSLTELDLKLPDEKSTDFPTFAELKQQMPKFFRKGQIGSWRNEMPDELQSLFWEYHGDVMHQLGYDEPKLKAIAFSDSKRESDVNNSHKPLFQRDICVIPVHVLNR